MKTLKFKPELVEKIISGEKTSTWRIFDEKDLQEGDSLIFINKETLKEFGTGVITNIKIKKLGNLEDSDWEGHEKFFSHEEMYKTYRLYYGDSVNQDTEVKIIKFNFNTL